MVEKTDKKRFVWIDACKCIAILAVIIDHLYKKSYDIRALQTYTAFSVGLFVFIGGINSANSIRNSISNIDTKKYLYRRCIQILIPYAFATFIYSFYQNNNFFDFIAFFKHLILFDTVGPFYFVLFYIQLLLISTILFSLFYASTSFKRKALFLFFSYIVGVICQKYSFILPVHAAGKYLFGGSYLFIFCAGICFDDFLRPISKKVSFWVFMSMFMCLLFIIIFDIPVHFNLFTNPPNIYTISYIFIIFCLIYTFSSIFTFIPHCISQYPIELFKFIGKYSLYIFLYHILFIDIAIKFNPNRLLLQWINISDFTQEFLLWVWIIFMCILPPSIINMLYDFTKNKISLASLKQCD
jgi:fucose 4-O-acetylase-like acetyltransferase